jgi:hypothetical protein
MNKAGAIIDTLQNLKIYFKLLEIQVSLKISRKSTQS